MAETTTILGKVMVTPKGAWSSNTEYDVLDIVTNGGGSYLAKQNVPSGTALSNTSYWLQIVEKGDKGDTATIAVGTVTTGTAGSSASIVNSGDSHDATFDFTIPRGDTGNGIASVVLLSSALNVDTYRITFTDGDHFDYNVTNASSGVWGSITGDLEDQTDLQDALDEKAVAISESASGSIVSIDDGAEQNVEALTVNIDPVQDLNGYDNPWPAGGGKNLLPMTLANIKTINSTGTWSGDTYTLYDVAYTVNTDDGGNVVSIKVNGTASAFSLLRLYNEITFTSDTILSGCASGGSYSGYKLEASGDTTRQDIGNGVTIPANEAKTRITITVPNGTTATNAMFYPMVRLATDADATFAPYSNICPITGHTQCNIYRETAYDENADPAVTIQLGQTVYGGSLNVLTGVLTVTKVGHTFDGTENISVSSNRFAYTIDSAYATVPSNSSVNCISSVYKGVTSNAIWSNRATENYTGIAAAQSNSKSYLFIVDNVNFTAGSYTASAFQTHLATLYANGTPLTVVWDLATPLTVQLTASDLTLLSGVNNVWADTGDIALTYRADTRTFIEDTVTEQQTLIGSVEIGTASRNYSINDFLLMNNVLYKVTSPIANGGDITVGTNVVATTITEQLTALLNA